jgi:membrane fusion protein, peptide pheromone/bacteriocin exporter
MNNKDLYPFSTLQDSLEGYYISITTKSKIIYWIIILAISFTLFLLPLIYVDISVQARGFFQPDIEKQTLTAPFSGKVLYSSIHTGKKIQKGDTLLIIDSQSLKAQKELLESMISENDASIADLEILTVLDPSSENILTGHLKTGRYFSESANFRKQHFIQWQKLKKIETEHERNTHLHSQDLIPDADFETSLYTLNAEGENLKQINLSQKASWQTDLSQRRNEAVRLSAEMKQVEEELKNRIVISPVGGEIIRSAEIQAGGFVNFNQMVVEISPDGELLATCFVKPSDIGMVYEQQPVLIQVDAFKYNEWGMLRGHITDISDDMILEGNSSAFFRIKCALEDKTLSLKNGYSADMKKGMSMTARMLVTRRSLFNLLFDKADKWFNPYMNNHNGENDADKG